MRPVEEAVQGEEQRDRGERSGRFASQDKQTRHHGHKSRGRFHRSTRSPSGGYGQAHADGACRGEQQGSDLRQPQLIDQVLMRSTARTDQPPHKRRQRHRRQDACRQQDSGGLSHHFQYTGV